MITPLIKSNLQQIAQSTVQNKINFGI